MAKNIKRGKHQTRQEGLSLSKFAGAKKSKYNKQARLEKKAALNAKRVNQYKKIKGKFFGNQTTGEPAQAVSQVVYRFFQNTGGIALSNRGKEADMPVMSCRDKLLPPRKLLTSKEQEQGQKLPPCCEFLV